MARLTLQLPEQLKVLAQSRAEQAGFSNVGEFVAQLIVGEAAGAPDGLRVHSDRQLKTLLESRIGGPFVEVHSEDFRQMRKKLAARLKSSKARS